MPKIDQPSQANRPSADTNSGAADASFWLSGLVTALVVVAGIAIGGWTLSSEQVAAAEPQAHPQQLLGKKLITRLKKVRPDIPILSVAESPVAGVYAIELEGGTMVYGTADGTHLFVGDLYSIGDDDLVNLAEIGRQQMRGAAHQCLDRFTKG